MGSPLIVANPTCISYKNRLKNVALSKTALEIKVYVITIGLAGLLSWGAWVMVVTQLDPYQSTATGLSLFTISLFFGLISLFTLLGFGLRRMLSQEEFETRHLSISLRQGLLLSACTLLCLLLLMAGVLRWWNGLLIVAIVVFLEMFFTSQS